ncbi:MAG: ABC transporter ATP-binding protein [bacterium]
MASLDVERVSFRRGATQILDDVSLSVADGEFLVVVGPSGSGKSSLLRIVAGLEAPDAGDVRIGGASVTARSPQERNLAMVFQNYALYPHMTVRQNLAFGLEVRRTPAATIDAEVRRVADLLGIAPHLAKKPGALSGGERQRVALGRALVRRPSVFLYDEPLSNLDARLREEMRTEIARLHALEPTTSLYVTHDQAEAMTLGERMAIFEGGRLRQVGAPDVLYRRPADLFVAGFLGSPRMNVVEGAVSERFFRAGSLSIPLAPAYASLVASGARATLGIRPEEVGVAHAGSARAEEARAGGAAANGSRARVTRVEHLGREALLHLDAGGVSLRALAPVDLGAAPGATVALLIPGDRIHLFDPRSGLRIAPDGEGGV